MKLLNFNYHVILKTKKLLPTVKEWIQEQVDKTEGETATCALSAFSIGKVKNQEVHKEAACSFRYDSYCYY